MATENVSGPAIASDALRLQCLESMCGTIAVGLLTALNALRDAESNPNTVHLVADALERLGWIADRAEGVASGSMVTSLRDGADAWLTGGDTAELLRRLQPAA